MQQDTIQRQEGGRRTRDVPAKQPLVSVITAVFNGGQYIAGCLESVLQQNYPNIEHIVLDGGSTDHTVDILRQYDDKIAYWMSEPDRGVYDAWNKGLREARGEWICFLGADDEFLPGAINACMKLASENPQAEYLSSQIRWMHESGHSRIFGEPWRWKRFLRSMCVAHVGSMHKCSFYERLGTYDASYRSAGDYELLLRARGSLRAAFMPVLTAMMRAGGVSYSTESLMETMRAKIQTGGCSSLLANVQLQQAKLGMGLGKLKRRLKSRYNTPSC